MEAPRGSASYFSLMINHFGLSRMHITGIMAKPQPLRLRGGTNIHPNDDPKKNDVPFLTKMNFSWDGLPCIDFIERIMYPVQNGLATVSFGSDTLLRAVKQVDKGGTLGNPPRSAGGADAENSITRCERAFSCIMNYIDHKSWFYIFAMRKLPGDGVTLFMYMREYGVITLPPKVRKAREDTWNKISMESLRIPWTLQGFFKWINIVLELGRRLNKDSGAQKNVFIEGLPTWFDSVKAIMRNETGVEYPATYGAIPGLATASCSADAHEMAGETSIHLLGLKHVNEWVTHCARVTKTPPSGMLYLADIAFEANVMEADIDSAHMLAKDITPQHKCNVCGGDSHTASFYLNGEKIVCPKLLLFPKHKKSTNESASNLDYSSTDKNAKYRDAYKQQREQIKLLSEQVMLLNTQVNQANHTDDTSGQESGAQSDIQGSEMSNDIDDDALSQDSATSEHIGDFANLAANSRRFGKRPMKKR